MPFHCFHQLSLCIYKELPYSFNSTFFLQCILTHFSYLFYAVCLLVFITLIALALQNISLVFCIFAITILSIRVSSIFTVFCVQLYPYIKKRSNGHASAVCTAYVQSLVYSANFVILLMFSIFYSIPHIFSCSTVPQSVFSVVYICPLEHFLSKYILLKSQSNDCHIQ